MGYAVVLCVGLGLASPKSCGGKVSRLGGAGAGRLHAGKIAGRGALAMAGPCKRIAGPWKTELTPSILRLERAG